MNFTRGYIMSELADFQYFKQHQLANVDFLTGQIDVYAKANITNKHSPLKGTAKIYVRKDVGSKNPDGYIRLWCGNKLRMKHRLLYWLYHGVLPNEIDHINKIRDDNSIHNLRSVDRKENVSNVVQINKKKFTDKELHQICQEILNGKSDTQLSKDFNCSRIAIRTIRVKKYHTNISDNYF